MSVGRVEWVLEFFVESWAIFRGSVGPCHPPKRLCGTFFTIDSETRTFKSTYLLTRLPQEVVTNHRDHWIECANETKQFSDGLLFLINLNNISKESNITNYNPTFTYTLWTSFQDRPPNPASMLDQE